MNSGPVPDSNHEIVSHDPPSAPLVDTLDRADAVPTLLPPPPKSPATQVADLPDSDVSQVSAPKHEGSNTEPAVSHSPAHIARALSPVATSVQPETEPVDTEMTSAPSAPSQPLPLEGSRSPTTSTHASLPQPQPAPTDARPPSYTTSPASTSGVLAAHPPSAHPHLQGHLPPPSDLPLTMVQSGKDGDLGLSARQLGQRARRARERELQAQGLYVPKRRTSSSATQPDLSAYNTISHAGQPSSLAPAQPASSGPPLPTPPATQGDVTMQSADEDGDDDGEGELEADLPPQSVGPSVLPAPGSASAPATPAVPPHTASHLIPPIAVLAQVTTPSRASLAQRARRERERAGRLGTSPNGSMSSPSGPDGSPSTLIYSTSQQTPIQLNPAQQVPPGSTHLATLGQFPQQPPTLTRGQLAQRARRARERVERASKAQNTEGWTPSLNPQEGVSSAGEAVFAVAPPPPSANGTTGFATTASQHNPGYGVGLGAAHVPQQLNRAQLAQRARRARERQQRVAVAGAHASGSPLVGENGSYQHRSPSSSAPPASPTSKHHTTGTSRTSLSPMASVPAPGNAPAALAINAQFTQVFKSLTAGDNGVSRAVADAGALTSKDDIKGRNASRSPTTDRVTSPPTSTQQGETNDMSVDEHMDQLSEDSTRATTPSRGVAPIPSLAADEKEPPKSLPAPTPPRESTPLMNTHEPKHVSPPAATPEVHMSNVQSVGA